MPITANKAVLMGKLSKRSFLGERTHFFRWALILFVFQVCHLEHFLEANEPGRFDGMIGINVDPAKTISQKILPENKAGIFCTEAAFLNALRFGPPAFQKVLAGLPCKTDQERLAYISETFGATPSVVNPDQKCSDGHGVKADDFPNYFNAILGHNVPIHPTGTYLDTTGTESPEAHVRRVHKLFIYSLQRGVPIIASIRSFGAEQHGEKFVWEGISAHAILIVGVREKILDQAEGFAFQFVDPWRGGLSEGYIYCEKVRGFAAIKGAGEKNFKWLDCGFLLAVVPSLNLETNNEPWYARTFMTLNYGLGIFAE